MSILFKRILPLTFSISPETYTFSENEEYVFSLSATGSGTETLTFNIDGAYAGNFYLSGTPASIAGGTSENFTIGYTGAGGEPSADVSVTGSNGNTALITIQGYPVG